MRHRIAILAVLALLIGVFPATAAVASPGTTTIFTIGDREPGSSSTVGMSEFSQTGWGDEDSYLCDGCSAAEFPAAVIRPARDGDGTIHDIRGVPIVSIQFDLTADYIDLALTLSKFGVEDDVITINVDDYTFITTGGIEGVWTEKVLAIPTLAAGTHTINIQLNDASQGNGAHVWDHLSLTGDQVPSGEITAPGDGQILLVGDTLYLGATYSDDDPGGVQWAVRKGTCAAGTNTVGGNVDGFSDGYSWDGSTFAASYDTSTWSSGGYCFILNPREDGNEPDMRLTREFRIADGHINGGGQIIEEIPGKKKPYKVSFGGELWRFGSTVECNWTVQFHKVSIEEVSGGVFHGSSCTLPGDFPDGGADGVTNFAVYGTFNGETGYTVIIRMEDFTEPGKQDTIRFELLSDPLMTATPGNSLGRAAIYDTSSKAPTGHPGQEFTSGSDNSGTARTLLDRGNLQIDLR